MDRQLGQTKTCPHSTRGRLEQDGTWLVVVVLTQRSDEMFIHDAAREHLIRVAEHLGVRLPASSPPRALDNQQLLAVEGSQRISVPEVPA